MLQPPSNDSIRMIIQLKRVALAVRFHCHLSFLLKNEAGEKLAEVDETYPVVRGECPMNECVEVEMPAQAWSHSCRRVKLVVMMVSANGMVPAGYVHFHPQPRRLYEQIELCLPLQRCQDGKAQLKLMHMYENAQQTPLEASLIHSLRSRAPPLLPPVSSRHRSAARHDHSLRKQQREGSVANTRSSWVKALASTRQQGPLSGRGAFDLIAEESVERGETPNESTVQQPSKEQLLREHQEYWEQLVRMEDELEGLRQENALLLQSNAHLREDCERVKEAFEQDEQKIHALVAEVQQNGATIQQLGQRLGEREDLSRQSQQRIAEIAEESRQKGQEAEEAMKAKDEVIRQQKESYEGEVEALREEMRVVGEAELQREAEKEQKISQLGEVVQQLERRVEEGQGKIAELEERNRGLQGGHKAEIESMIQAQMEQEDRIGKIQTATLQTEKALKQQLKQLRQEKDQLQLQLTEAQHALAQTNSARETLHSSLSALTLQKEESSQENQRLELDLRQRLSENSQLEEALAEMELAVGEERRKFEQELGTLGQEMSQLKWSKNALEEQLGRAREELISSQLQKDQLGESKMHLEAQIAQLTAQLSSYNHQVKRLEGDVQKARSAREELRVSEEARARLEADFGEKAEEWEGQRRALESELGEVKEFVKGKIRQILVLKGENNSLKRQLAAPASD